MNKHKSIIIYSSHLPLPCSSCLSCTNCAEVVLKKGRRRRGTGVPDNESVITGKIHTLQLFILVLYKYMFENLHKNK